MWNPARKRERMLNQQLQRWDFRNELFRYGALLGGMGVDSRTGERTTQQTDDLSADTALNLLAKRRRRLALDCLERHEMALSLADLAEEVAVAENDTPLPDIDKQEVLRVYSNLYHNHIPRLTDHGVVEYEQKRDLVQLSNDTNLVMELLSVLPDDGFGR